jgi:hypothetical protein
MVSYEHGRSNEAVCMIFHYRKPTFQTTVQFYKKISLLSQLMASNLDDISREKYRSTGSPRLNYYICDVTVSKP